MERKVRRRAAYPIHKKLNFSSDSISDIYDWLCSKVQLQPVSTVLDAGCGVGFGSLRIAEIFGCDVTGISLSSQEISQARETTKQQGMDDKVQFLKKSYDDAFDQQYDLIVAVESLKHSTDLMHTLQNLCTHLRDQGRLVIVEDFYKLTELTETARRFAADWKLVDTFRKEDYYKILAEENCDWYDFTNLMSTKSKVVTRLQIAMNTILHAWKGGSDMDVYKIFRGGYYLDQLYTGAHMSYGALIYRKS